MKRVLRTHWWTGRQELTGAGIRALVRSPSVRATLRAIQRLASIPTKADTEEGGEL